MNNKKLVFVFGRFQVPTKGHAELIHFVTDLARRTGAEARVYTSQSHDKDKNPLPYELKLMFLRQLFPGVNIVQSPHKILWQILKEISDQGYDDVTLVTGADRVKLFKQTFLPHCKPRTDPTFDKSKNYGFKLKVISSGARKKGISGTDTRNLIKKGDFKAFLKVSATTNPALAKRIFDAAKTYMVEETVNEIRRPEWPQHIQSLKAAQSFRKMGLKAAVDKDPQTGTSYVNAVRSTKENPAPKDMYSVDAQDNKRSHFSATYHKKGMRVHSVSSHEPGLGSKMIDKGIDAAKTMRKERPTIDLHDQSPKTKERKGFLGLGGRKTFWDKKSENRKDVDWKIHENLNEDLSRKDFDKMLRRFVDFTCDHLKIKDTPEIEYKNPDDHGEQPSFGGYAPSNKKIIVMSKNRHPMDIFRTVAHELVHHKQNEDGRLGHSAEEGSTGSDIENEANSMAGIVMRHFGKAFPDTFTSSFVTEETIEEGVHDKALFKAVFLAGGAGSGKDFILKRCLEGHGLKELNSDQAYTYLLKKNNLSLKMPPEEHHERNIQRGRAKNITQSQKQLQLGGRNGVIINGTADDYNKMFHLKKEYENLGYETMMLFVGTSNKTSRNRNIERGKLGDREVPEDIRYKKWIGSHKNKERFRELFGADHFIFVDNSIDVRNAPPEIKSRIDSLHHAIWKKIHLWTTKPVNNQHAHQWKSNQRGYSISEMDELFDKMLNEQTVPKIRKKMKTPQIAGDRISDTLGKQTDYMNMGLPASDPIGVWSVKEETRKRFKERYGELAEAKIRDTVTNLRKTYKESMTDPFVGSMANVSATTGNDELGTNGVNMEREREKLSLFGKKKKRLNRT